MNMEMVLEVEMVSGMGMENEIEAKMCISGGKTLDGWVSMWKGGRFRRGCDGVHRGGKMKP